MKTCVICERAIDELVKVTICEDCQDDLDGTNPYTQWENEYDV